MLIYENPITFLCFNILSNCSSSVELYQCAILLSWIITFSENAIIIFFPLFLSNTYLPDLFLCVIALAKTHRISRSI